MNRKEAILDAIADLKANKPDGWKRSCRQLLRDLAWLEDPYAEHEDHGTEQRGRRIHKTDGCPAYDRMGDEAQP